MLVLQVEYYANKGARNFILLNSPDPCNNNKYKIEIHKLNKVKRSYHEKKIIDSYQNVDIVEMQNCLFSHLFL